MALVTNYSTLQDHIADTLNRADLTGVIPNFIQQFESRAKLGIEVSPGEIIPLRQLTDRGTIQISADGLALPTDFGLLESWYHDGATYFGPIGIVTPNQIGKLKAAYGDTGVPQFAAIVDGLVRFAPEPDTTYSTQLTYWRKVVSLSDTQTTNWLLTQAPDIYLYGALVEAAPYLKDDDRVALWESQLRSRVRAFDAAQTDAMIGGAIQRTYTPFGG